MSKAGLRLRSAIIRNHCCNSQVTLRTHRGARDSPMASWPALGCRVTIATLSTPKQTLCPEDFFQAPFSCNFTETARVGPGRSNFDVESSAACRRCFNLRLKRVNNGEYLCFTYNQRIMKRPSQSKAAKQRHFAWTLRMQHFQVCPWQASGVEMAPEICFY